MRRKPYNMKYTDLCIYIDKTIYERDENNNPIGLRKLNDYEISNVYNYLYNIVFALSSKKRLFTKQQDYDDFSIEAAGNLYLRLTAKDQNYDQNATSNRAVKSILNYIKGALPFMAITWRNSYYSSIIGNMEDDRYLDSVSAFLNNQASEQYNDKRKKAIEELFSDLPVYVEKSIKKGVFKKNKLDKYYICMSEYLTLLNCITLEKKFENLSDNRKTNKIENQLLNKKYYIINYGDNPIITNDIIDLELRKSLFLLENEKEGIDRDFTPSDQELNDILSTAFSNYSSSE